MLDATIWLGASVGRLLGDLGADVAKLETPDGTADRRRGYPLPGGTSAWWAFSEAGKRGIVLDPHEEDCADRPVDLLAEARVLITSEGPALRRRGLAPEAIRARYPGLVHVSVSLHGLDGPYADRPVLVGGRHRTPVGR
ncbi:CoA transferase [Streptomyces sp. NPDC051217]|uniref:CoA transferase n=1 Tax=Streptomyces sp. NPDC051217 TaxID=3365644 RepID=UPI00378B0B6D